MADQNGLDRMTRHRRRVAITGLGVVAKAGSGVDAFWDGLCAVPEDGMRQIEDFDPTPFFANPKEARRSDRFAQFALAATHEAVGDAGLADGAPPYDPVRCGVFVATGIGGIETLEEQILVHDQKGPRRVSPFLIPMMMPNAAGASVSMRVAGPVRDDGDRLRSRNARHHTGRRPDRVGPMRRHDRRRFRVVAHPDRAAGLLQHDRPVQ